MVQIATPIFTQSPKSAAYRYGNAATPLVGTAIVTDGSFLFYRWQRSEDGGQTWENIAGATSPAYLPPTNYLGTRTYRVTATAEDGGLYPGAARFPSDALYPVESLAASITSATAAVRVYSKQEYNVERRKDYLEQLRRPFTKLCRLRFLNPDGSTAFAVDSSPGNRRSGAFIADGTLSMNWQNGARRTASVRLANPDGAFSYNVNKVWFGQEVALDEGLVLSDGTDYYIQQGVFLIDTPKEKRYPAQNVVEYDLVDKWANLDGSLFGNLEGTYTVERGTNIYTPITALLSLERGSGVKVDAVKPVFTAYYNGKTQTLQDGTSVPVTNAPYTLKVDSEDGTMADVVLGISGMLNAWVGYDANGALRLDASQDDILDDTKPVMWKFGQQDVSFLGAAYSAKNTEIFNDIIVWGEEMDGRTQPGARATNMDGASDTNIYTGVGRKTKRIYAGGLSTVQQCRDLAVWKLKRMTVLQKSVEISCSQIFHIDGNNLVEIVRTDKPGSPVERHLVQGFTRPLSGSGKMTVQCVSVQDFPVATVSQWPLTTT